MYKFRWYIPDCYLNTLKKSVCKICKKYTLKIEKMVYNVTYELSDVQIDNV